jgi:CDP-diacylglycerol---glycerol-3-phosphate 3-phosphatidyltransferase
MGEIGRREKIGRGFFSDSFIRFFRGMFLPLSRFLKRAGVTPNMVTFASLAFGILSGMLFALNHIYWGFATGLLMGFSDIVDGQLAKEFGGESKFGGVLDSTIDRYNEFFIFAGFAWRYHSLGREVWIVLCALAFLGSIMISYVKSRAETAGFECKVGRLQRPERLALIGVGVLANCLGIDGGIDAAIAFLAVATQFTAVSRLVHVWNQAKRQ